MSAFEGTIYFQSPFYRVFECNFWYMVQLSWSIIESFSPLSIGSLSVTVILTFQIKIMSCLSVPFYRVFECNCSRQTCPPPGCSYFQSPFYRVFECNDIRDWDPEHKRMSNFQSPFYRVFECNSNRQKIQNQKRQDLSVPFLSGL